MEFPRPDCAVDPTPGGALDGKDCSVDPLPIVFHREPQGADDGVVDSLRQIDDYQLLAYGL